MKQVFHPTALLRGPDAETGELQVITAAEFFATLDDPEFPRWDDRGLNQILKIDKSGPLQACATVQIQVRWWRRRRRHRQLARSLARSLAALQGRRLLLRRPLWDGAAAGRGCVGGRWQVEDTLWTDHLSLLKVEGRWMIVRSGATAHDSPMPPHETPARKPTRRPVFLLQVHKTFTPTKLAPLDGDR